jgi:hypothetical protein
VWSRKPWGETSPHTVDEGGDNKLPVLFHQVIHITKDSAARKHFCQWGVLRTNRLGCRGPSISLRLLLSLAMHSTPQGANPAATPGRRFCSLRLCKHALRGNSGSQDRQETAEDESNRRGGGVVGRGGVAPYHIVTDQPQATGPFSRINSAGSRLRGESVFGELNPKYGNG